MRPSILFACLFLPVVLLAQVSIPWSDIDSTSTPTTLSGYGITDAQPLDSDLTAISAGTWTGATSITTLGTIGTGTWQGTAIADSYIATALTGKTYNGLTISTTTGTLTLANGSTLATSGANSITLTSTGATNVTLPTSGTLAALDGTNTWSAANTFSDNLSASGIFNASRSVGTYGAGYSQNHVLSVTGIGNAAGTTDTSAAEIFATIIGTNNAAGIKGSSTYAYVNGTSGTLTTAMVNAGEIQVVNGMDVTNGRGYSVLPRITGAGDIGTFTYFYASPGIFSSTGRVDSEIRGIYIGDIGHADTDVNYGVRVLDQTKGSGNAYAYHTNMAAGSGGKFAVYSSGSAPSYHSGEFMIGSSTDQGAYAIQVTGAAYFSSTIRTAAGVDWNLGGYTAGAPTPDGYLTVTVGGATYRISADLQ